MAFVQLRHLKTRIGFSPKKPTVSNSTSVKIKKSQTEGEVTASIQKQVAGMHTACFSHYNFNFIHIFFSF